MNTKIILPLGAFFLGALAMLVVRAASLEPLKEVEPSTHGDRGVTNEGAPHGQDHHVDEPPVAEAGATPEPKKIDQKAAPREEEEEVEVWVCGATEEIGMSYEGVCPLDGTPMRKTTRKVSEAGWVDLQNPRCPVMGGATQEDVFAFYHGVKVRFCCPGCDGAFFDDPEQMIQRARGAK